MTTRTHIRGVDLSYERHGAGERPLIWGHGLTSSRAREDDGLILDWQRLIDGHDIVRYDARGHGDSGTTTGAAEYGWDQMALDQLDLASALGIERYVAGGASLGAATALHAAVAAPERIAGLLLVIPPTSWETRAAQASQYEKMASVLDRYGIEPLLTAAGDALPVPDPFAGRGVWEVRQAEALRSADPARLSVIFRGAATADMPPRERVTEIDVPTRILAWSGDTGHPLSSANELAALIPHAELSVASTWSELQTWTDEAVTFLAGI